MSEIRLTDPCSRPTNRKDANPVANLHRDYMLLIDWTYKSEFQLAT